MRVFLDTNVFISVLITKGKVSFRAFEIITKSPDHELITCTLVIEELIAKLDSKFGIAASDPFLKDFLYELDEYEIIQTPQKPLDIPIKGLNDARIITASTEADIDIFLTGNNELLALGSIGKMRIMKPGRFLEFIGKSTTDD